MALGGEAGADRTERTSENNSDAVAAARPDDAAPQPIPSDTASPAGAPGPEIDQPAVNEPSQRVDQAGTEEGQPSAGPGGREAPKARGVGRFASAVAAAIVGLSRRARNSARARAAAAGQTVAAVGRSVSGGVAATGRGMSAA